MSNNGMLNNRKCRPTHPGEFLREDILPATGLTKQEFADRLGLSRRAINEVLNERRPVTMDLALRLARMFNTTPDVWVNMQVTVDLWEASQANRQAYEKIKPLKVA